jgi:hypothetical protein
MLPSITASAKSQSADLVIGSDRHNIAYDSMQDLPCLLLSLDFNQFLFDDVGSVLYGAQRVMFADPSRVVIVGNLTQSPKIEQKVGALVQSGAI